MSLPIPLLRSVSGMTSAENEPSSMRAAVKQTPLTAMLPPTRVRPRLSAAPTRMAPSSIAKTRPTSATIPENIRPSPSERHRFQQQVVAQGARVDELQPQSLGQVGEALAVDRRGCPSSPPKAWSDERVDAVDGASGAKTPGKVSPAFDQHAVHALVGEQLQQGQDLDAIRSLEGTAFRVVATSARPGRLGSKTRARGLTLSLPSTTTRSG